MNPKKGIRKKVESKMVSKLNFWTCWTTKERKGGWKQVDARSRFKCGLNLISDVE